MDSRFRIIVACPIVVERIVFLGFEEIV